MSRERWFRGDREEQERSFDWYGLARARDIPADQARVLYDEALRRRGEERGGRGSVRDIYLALIEEAQRVAWRPSPGKVTRTMRLEAERAGQRRRRSHISRLTGRPIAPGKRTLTSYLEPAARERRSAKEASNEAPGSDAVPAEVAQPEAPAPAEEGLVPGTAAYRRYEATMAAAYGHFEELDALEEEEAAAGAGAEAWLPRERPEAVAGSTSAEAPIPAMAGDAVGPGWFPALPAMAAASARPAAIALDRMPGRMPGGMPGRAPGARAPDRDDLDEALVQRLLAGLESSPGEPLPPALARRMGQVLGHDFAHVRVHTDARAAQAAALLGARAFTHGARIYFGRGQWAPDSEVFERLLAHELTHVVQHDRGRLQPAPGGGVRVAASGDSSEREAEAVAARVPAGAAERDPAPAGGVPEAQDAQGARGAAGPDAAADGVVSRLPSLSDVLPISTIVRQVSPGLADLIDEGPLGMIQGLIEAGLDALLSPVASIAGSIGGTIDSLTSSFAEAFQFIQGLFAGDPACCEAFVDGIDRIRGLARSIAENPAVQAIQDGLGLLSGAIEKVALLVLSPAFDAVKELLGGAWEGITGLAETISGWLQPVMDFSEAAWEWVMDQLGMGGGEGEGGILSWLTDVAGEAWDAIAETLAPVAGPLKAVGGVLLALSPVGPLMALVAYGPELVEAVQWLWQNRENPGIVQQAHAEMGGTILPGLLSAAQGFGGALQSAATWLVEQATSLSTGLLELLGAVTGVPLLSMVQGAVQTLADGAASLAAWATGALSAAAQGLQDGFAALGAFIEPYADVLCSVGLAIANPLMIPVILAGHAWMALPDCIKAPIIDLLLDAAIVVLEASPSLIFFGPLWAILKSGIIGFLRGLRAQPPEVKEQVGNKLARILSGSSPAFLLGFVKGFLQGVWEGLTDPFVLIWSAVQGLGNLVSWLGGLAQQAFGQQGGAEAPGGGAQAGLPSRDELGTRAGEMMGELQPPVEQVTGGFMPAMRALFQGGEGMTLEQLIARLGEAWSAMEQAIQGAGAGMADRVCEFFMADEAEGKLGESVGWLAGTIAFEVVLGILTAGAWQPVSAAGRALKAFARILDWTGEALGAAFRLLGRIGGLLLDALRGLGRMLANAGGVARQVLDALGQIGRKLMAFADELMARFGRGVAGEATEEAGERAAREGAEEVVEEAAEEVVEEAAEEVVEETAEEVAEEAAEEASERIIRQDDDFDALANHKGVPKSYLDANGNLVPANPDGATSPLEHIYGSSPAKDDSPFSSFLTERGGAAKNYGKNELELDLSRLQADIQAGRLPDVELLTPDDIDALIREDIAGIASVDIDAAIANGPAGIGRYLDSVSGLSRSKRGKLERRLLAYYNTTRDGEYLIRGIVPSEYLAGPNPVRGTP